MDDDIIQDIPDDDTCRCKKDGDFYFCPKHYLYGKVQINISAETLDLCNC